jgi:hypothetical protein
LAKELNVLFVTASQLNRSAVEEVEFDHSHISGGISKINTADNVFGIFTSRAMRERGRSEELRNLAREFGILMITASQLNRSAVEEIEFDHSHISGGISKINTADNVFGIFTSRAMRERGRYQIQLMKTRSSSGVGMKVDLDFDIETLRITDPGEDAQGTPGTVKPQVGSIMSNMKAKSNVSSDSALDEESRPRSLVPPGGTKAWDKPMATAGGEIQSAKLKNMLAGLKKLD